MKLQLIRLRIKTSYYILDNRKNVQAKAPQKKIGHNTLSFEVRTILPENNF